LPTQDAGWVSKYNLIDGTVLTSIETDPVNYITKGIEVAEVSSPVDLLECATLDIATVFTNADIDPTAISVVQKPSVGLDDWPNI